jgi:4-alpha-glucanotransferase
MVKKPRKPKRTKPKDNAHRDNGEAKRVEVLANKMMKPAIGSDFGTVLCAIARLLDDIGHQSYKVFESQDY